MNPTRKIIGDASSLFVGQLAVIGFGVADTMLLGRYAPEDLASLSIGISVSISVIVAMFGVISALMPLIGRSFGAKDYAEVGHTVQQGVYLALICSAIAVLPLVFSSNIMAWAQVPPELQPKVQLYMRFIALSVPFSLLFRVYSALNVGTSRPFMVTLIQLAALPVKVAISAWLIFGGLGVPAMGSPGAGLATAITMLLMFTAAFTLLARDASYQRYQIFVNWQPPSARRLINIARIGVPAGASMFVEVTSFTMMTIFIVRLGTEQLAGHQIASNVATVLFMLPLSLGMAAGALCAQHLGAQQPQAARHVAFLALRLTAVICAVIGIGFYLAREQIAAIYTPHVLIAALAAKLFIFIALYQVGDALQCMASHLLRSYKIATAPLIIYTVGLWGVGLAGGYALCFNVTGNVPLWAQGANGFWIASSISLALVAVALIWILRVVSNETLSKPSELPISASASVAA